MEFFPKIELIERHFHHSRCQSLHRHNKYLLRQARRGVARDLLARVLHSRKP